jgi:hypothetical protein
MRTLIALACGLLLVAAPASVRAWGVDVHRFLTRRAIDGLPGDLKAFFAPQREFVVEHSVDPDLWRVVALRGALGEEDPNHFLDIDDLGDDPPFRNVPRTWTGMVAAYGSERANKAGRLPWRAEEIFNRLTTMFAELGRPGGSPYAADNARYLSAVLAHYVEDAHQPFHATRHFDGQFTGQRGIHARYETTLVMRHLSSMTLAPVVIEPIADVRAFMFDAIVKSQGRVAAALAADRRAAQGRDEYDDAYYQAFFAAARPGLEQQLSESASGVASLIVRAWEQAGRLSLAMPPRPASRIPAPAGLRERAGAGEPSKNHLNAPARWWLRRSGPAKRPAGDGAGGPGAKLPDHE